MRSGRYISRSCAVSPLDRCEVTSLRPHEEIRHNNETAVNVSSETFQTSHDKTCQWNQEEEHSVALPLPGVFIKIYVLIFPDFPRIYDCNSYVYGLFKIFQLKWYFIE